MRKEIILAIILGVILGLIIIFGINLANQSAGNNPPPTQKSLRQEPDQPTPTPAPTLQVTSPEDHAVSFKDSLVLIGTTKKQAWVSLIWETGETMLQADDQGRFQQEIDLIGGENILRITSANNQGYQESLELTVIYTTAQITDLDSDTQSGTDQSQDATSSATDTSNPNQVDQNLKKRIQKIVKGKFSNDQKNDLKGYVGTISKINNSAIVVDTPQDKTLQITTSNSTDVVRNGQDIQVSSLSIDEKIIIIGLLDTEDILSAKRIVAIKDSAPTHERQTIIGPVSNLNTKDQTLDIGKLNIDIPKKSNIDISKLQENQVVMAILKTDLENNTHTLISLQPLLQ